MKRPNVLPFVTCVIVAAITPTAFAGPTWSETRRITAAGTSGMAISDLIYDDLTARQEYNTRFIPPNIDDIHRTSTPNEATWPRLEKSASSTGRDRLVELAKELPQGIAADLSPDATRKLGQGVSLPDPQESAADGYMHASSIMLFAPQLLPLELPTTGALWADGGTGDSVVRVSGVPLPGALAAVPGMLCVLGVRQFSRKYFRATTV